MRSWSTASDHGWSARRSSTAAMAAARSAASAVLSTVGRDWAARHHTRSPSSTGSVTGDRTRPRAMSTRGWRTTHVAPRSSQSRIVATRPTLPRRSAPTGNCSASREGGVARTDTHPETRLAAAPPPATYAAKRMPLMVSTTSASRSETELAPVVSAPHRSPAAGASTSSAVGWLTGASCAAAAGRAGRVSGAGAGAVVGTGAGVRSSRSSVTVSRTVAAAGATVAGGTVSDGTGSGAVPVPRSVSRSVASSVVTSRSATACATSSAGAALSCATLSGDSSAGSPSRSRWVSTPPCSRYIETTTNTSIVPRITAAATGMLTVVRPCPGARRRAERTRPPRHRAASMWRCPRLSPRRRPGRTSP